MIRSTKSRRAFAAVAGIAALTLAAACGTTSDDDNPSADKCGLKIAYFGALTGPAAALGVNAANGAELAVEQYNAKNADCKVELIKKDSQSDPEQATGLAENVIADDSVVGVVGPLFSGESKAADPKFDEAGVPMITASATNPGLSANGWTSFHRILGNDADQGPQVANLIHDVAKVNEVFVIDDASEYGKGLADEVKKDMGDEVVGSDTIEAGKTEFPATVTAVVGKNPKSVFFGGYYPEGSLLIKQLRAGGWKGIFVTADGVKDPEYIKVAKTAAEGTLMTCPCVPGENLAEFAAAYKAKFNVDPGTYSPEAFDAANVFLAGIAAGKTTRADLNSFIDSYDAPGITKQVSFEANGESKEIPIWAYEVKDGVIVPVKQLA